MFQMTQRRFLIVGLLSLVFAFMTIDTTSSGIDFSALEKQIEPAVVLIETQIGRGSGFIVDDSGIIVTACHVVNVGTFNLEIGGSQIRVVEVSFKDDPRIYLATIENQCQSIGPITQRANMLAAATDDVAILKVVGFFDEQNQFQPLITPTGFSKLSFSKQEFNISETTFVVGFGGPFGEFSFNTGTLAGFLPLVVAPVEQIEVGLDLFIGRLLNLSQDTFGLLVAELVAGGASESAGVQVGDAIIAVDGAAINFSTTFQRLASLVVGERVHLGLLRPGVGLLEAEVEVAQFTLSRAIRFIDTLWCFNAQLESLSNFDFNTARSFNLIQAKNTLARAVEWVRGCPMVLASAFGGDGNQPAFEYVGVLTGIEADTLVLEELSNFALTPFAGDLIRLGRISRLQEFSFPRITALSGPGFSGGPVLNTSGQVVGFVDFGLNNPAPGYIVDNETILPHLNQVLAED